MNFNNYFHHAKNQFHSHFHEISVKIRAKWVKNPTEKPRFESINARKGIKT